MSSVTSTEPSGTEEGAFLHAQDLAGGELLVLAEHGKFVPARAGLVRSGGPVGDADVSDADAFVGPLGHRPRRAEFGVIRVGEHNQCSFECHVGEPSRSAAERRWDHAADRSR
jgi:hypothetical protein